MKKKRWDLPRSHGASSFEDSQSPSEVVAALNIDVQATFPYSVFETDNPRRMNSIYRGELQSPPRPILAHIGTRWIAETVQLLRKHKHKQIYTDLSARFYRKWELFTGMMQLIDYKVIPQVLFGSYFPMKSSVSAADSFREIEAYTPQYNLPHIPRSIIEDIFYNRPLSLI